MDKKQFLELLQSKLQGFPEEDIKRSLDFYSEMIDDRIENGESEEEAVASLGNIDDIVAKILEDTPLPRLVKERVRPKRALASWEMILLVLGAPLWIPLVIAILSVVMSVFVVIWSVVISVIAVFVALGASAVAFIAAGIFFLITGKTVQGVILLGVMLICTGAAMITFVICRALIKGFISVSRGIITGIKTAFVGKGEKK